MLRVPPQEQRQREEEERQRREQAETKRYRKSLAFEARPLPAYYGKRQKKDAPPPQ